MKSKSYNNIEEKKKKLVWWLEPVMMFLNLSVWIIIPILSGSLIGQWLDNKFNTQPWLFLIFVGLAFIVSMSGLIKNTIKEYNRAIKNIDKNETRNKHN
jgi:F0F1-type ATP synthase assembly protein I